MSDMNINWDQTADVVYKANSGLEREKLYREVPVEILERGDGRTLVSRLVPYNEVATVDDGRGTYREMFLPGAFRKQLNAPDRIKAFLNFRHGQRLGDVIGHAKRIFDRADGLHGELRVLDVPDGEKALELYRAGVLDKLSIEFESIKHRTVDGVVQRVAARLVGVALTPEGSYLGAEVYASREPAEDEEQKDLFPAFNPELAASLTRYVQVPARLQMSEPQD